MAKDLDNFIKVLLGQGKELKPIIKLPQNAGEASSKLNRQERALYFMPESFAKTIKEKESPSYYSWILHNHRLANAVFEKNAELFKENYEAILAEMDTKIEILMSDEINAFYDRDRLIELLNLYCTEYSELKVHPECKNTIELLYNTMPHKALSRMFLVLELGTHVSECLKLILPEYYSALDTDKNAESFGNGIEDSFRYGEYLYNIGKKDKAYEAFVELLNKNSDKKYSQIEGKLHWRIGKMLQDGMGCSTNPSQAVYHFMQASKTYPQADYELYLCYRNGMGCSVDEKKAKSRLMKCVKENEVHGVREYVKYLYMGDEALGIKAEPEKIYPLVKDSFLDDDICMFYYGKYLMDNDRYSIDGKYYVMRAAQAGILEAVRAILMNQTSECEQEGTKITDFGEDFECIVNSENDITRRFTEGFYTGKNVVKQFDRGNMEKYVYAGKNRRQIFYFFNDDQKKNLSDGLAVLSVFKGDLLKNYSDFAYAKKVAENVDIYIRNDEEYAQKIIDNMMAGMIERYIRVHICNIKMDSAYALYRKAPLFIPLTERPENAGLNLVIAGDADNCFYLVRSVVSIAYMNRKINISVISDEASKVEKNMNIYCPGIKKHKELMTKLNINYINKSAEDVMCIDLSDDADGGCDELKETIFCGDYFIAALNNGYENVQLSMKLREIMFRGSNDYEKQPFIAAFCPEYELENILSVSSVGNQNIGYQWYNNYNIYSYGNMAELYSWDSLIDNELEKKALTLHLSYYGENVKADEASYYNACRDFYGRSYNKNSSECCVISALYRMFMAGIYWGDRGTYANRYLMQGLADKYDAWIADENHLKEAACNEHNRWNWYMISQGWLGAKISQVASYMQQGNPRHQLDIARLHPYICSFEELGDDTCGVQAQITPILKHYKNIEHINLKKLDEDNVKQTKFIMS